MALSKKAFIESIDQVVDECVEKVENEVIKKMKEELQDGTTN